MTMEEKKIYNINVYTWQNGITLNNTKGWY